MMRIDSAAFWWMIVAIAIGTFLLRFSFVLLAGRVAMPAGVQRLLRFVPAAVLSALVFPALMFREGGLALHAGNERLLAGAIAGVVAIRTKNVVLTIAVGMASLWMLQSL